MPFKGGNGRSLLRLLPFRRAGGGGKAVDTGATGDRPTVDGAADDAPTDGLAIASRLAVPIGLAVSCIAHLAFLTPAIMLGGAKPFHTAPADAIMVDIVSSEDIAHTTGDSAPADAAKQADADTTPSTAADLSPHDSPPKDSPPKDLPPQNPPAKDSPPAPAPQTAGSVPAPQPASAAPSKPVEAAATSQAVAAHTMPSQSMLPALPFALPQSDLPQTDEPDDPSAVFGMPVTMPDGTVGGRPFDQAEEKADVTKDAAAAFRSHLKTCAKRPAEVAPGARVVMRLYLNPDGSLVTGLPENPKTLRVSMGGGELFMNARAALIQCQPYTMLPPDRYAEWKMLDLTFTAQNFP